MDGDGEIEDAYVHGIDARICIKGLRGVRGAVGMAKLCLEMQPVVVLNSEILNEDEYSDKCLAIDAIYVKRN